MKMFRHILLASQSPRRQFLLKEAGFSFSTVKAEVEEIYPPGLQKGEVALFLSRLKSFAYQQALGDSILLTADTIVCLGDRVIGKPSGTEEAVEMLRSLSGNMHEVYTAVCLRAEGKEHSFTERTEVYFKNLTDEEINHYVSGWKPLDKAGAYGIQEWLGYIGISRINGCFYNVMGLPLSRLYDELKAFR